MSLREETQSSASLSHGHDLFIDPSEKSGLTGFRRKVPRLILLSHALLH